MEMKALTGVERARLTRIALFSGNDNYTLDGANLSLNRLVGHPQDKLGATVRVYSSTSPKPAFAPVGDRVSMPSVKIPSRADDRLALQVPERTADRPGAALCRPDPARRGRHRRAGLRGRLDLQP